MQKEENEARSAMLEETMNLLNLAYKSATNFEDGIPIKSELDKAEEHAELATKKFTDLGVIEPLTDAEATQLSKLETHEQGVFSDPDRCVCTPTLPPPRKVESPIHLCVLRNVSALMCVHDPPFP